MSKVSTFNTFCCICTSQETGEEVAKYMKGRLLTKYGTKYKVKLDWDITIDKDKVDTASANFVSCKYCIFIFTEGCTQDCYFETCWKHADQYRLKGLTNVIGIRVEPLRQEDLPDTMQNLHKPISFRTNFKDDDENWEKVLECLSPDNVLTSGSPMPDNLTDEVKADYESRSLPTPSKTQTPQQAMVQAVSVCEVSDMENTTHPPKENAEGDCSDGGDDHIFCFECGKPLNRPNAKHCTKCGKEQKQIHQLHNDGGDDHLFCYECGKPLIRPNAKHCTKCGKEQKQIHKLHVSNMETMTISPAHPSKEKAGGDCPDGDDDIFCCECGKQLIRPNAKYCTKCREKQ